MNVNVITSALLLCLFKLFLSAPCLLMWFYITRELTDGWMFGNHWPDVAVLCCTVCHYLMLNASSCWPTSCLSSQSLDDWLRQAMPEYLWRLEREREWAGSRYSHSRYLGTLQECWMSAFWIIHAKCKGWWRCVCICAFGDSCCHITRKMAFTVLPFKHTHTHTYQRVSMHLRPGQTSTSKYDVTQCHVIQSTDSHLSLWTPWQQVGWNLYFQPWSAVSLVTVYLFS